MRTRSRSGQADEATPHILELAVPRVGGCPALDESRRDAPGASRGQRVSAVPLGGEAQAAGGGYSNNKVFDLFSTFCSTVSSLALLETQLCSYVTSSEAPSGRSSSLQPHNSTFFVSLQPFCFVPSDPLPSVAFLSAAFPGGCQACVFPVFRSY